MQTNWKDEEWSTKDRRICRKNRTAQTDWLTTWQPNRISTSQPWTPQNLLNPEIERKRERSCLYIKQNKTTSAATIITFRKQQKKLYILYFLLWMQFYSFYGYEGRSYRKTKANKKSLECNSLFFFLLSQTDELWTHDGKVSREFLRIIIITSFNCLVRKSKLNVHNFICNKEILYKRSFCYFFFACSSGFLFIDFSFEDLFPLG